MREMIAITVLMFGLGAGAMAQNYPSSTQAHQTADTQSTDNKKEQKEAPPQNHECKADNQSSANQKDSCPDCENAEETMTPEAPQNVVEYGG